jgi:release factor glutamine methyltransferase
MSGRAEGSGRSWSVLELLRWTQAHFAGLGLETPRLDAEVLLAHALGVERLQLYLDFEKPVGPGERATFRELVRRRGGERVPVAQLTGRKEFWSLPLEVAPEVLAPRPETETLVEAALALAPERDAELRVLDVGTGTGALALALAKERPKAHIIATDICPKSLQIARRNADKLGMAERIELLEGSGYAPVRGRRFDLVVSNPPYLAESERGRLAPELAHEPAHALFAGPDGLAVLRELVAGAPDALRPGGALALELAPAQAPAVAGACLEAGLVEVAVRRDLAGRPRVVCARREGE